MSEIITVSGGDFAGAAFHDGATVTASLKGNADHAALDAVELLLTRAHAEAKQLGAREMVIDLRQLEFMNSSCFKCFLSWITDIQALETDRQYRVKFLSNPKLHWQKRSLHSLRCFALELITVTES